MVLQRRLDYGFNGYQVPAMPRGSRSARGKVLFKKKAENNQMCAFDLLATVAGELLQEKDTSPNHSNQSVGQVDLLTRKDIVKKEEQVKEKLFKPGPYDQGSCDESVYAFPEKLQQHAQNGNLKHYCHAHGDTSLKPSSLITKSDRFEEVAYPEESTGKGRNGFGTSPVVSHANSSVQRGFPAFAESYNCKVEEELERQLQPQDGRIGSRGLPDMCNSEDPIDTKPPPLVSSDSSVEVPLSGDRISEGVFFNRCQNDIKIASRDDDENSSGCTQPRSTTMKTLRPPRIGDRRMRKLLASKCWKVAPVSLKHGNLSYYDMEMKPAFRSRRMCYTRQRTQRGATFKRRKLYGRYSMLISDGRNSNGVSSSANKGMNGATTASCVTIHGATSGSSSLLSGQKSSFASGDSHVKLSIKSFKIPELLIDIPETDTVGSLKRAVLEAVTAILDGGLRVGVLHQGKKVRDDKKTLLQTGISHDDKLDSLGFILEPSTALPPPLYTDDTHIHALHKAPQQQTRCPTVPALDQGVADPSPDLAQITTGHFTESDHDLALPSSDIPLDNASSNSTALVAVSPMAVEALAVVPLHRKSRRSDFVQRRIRRPFSVSEVEALVQAVERLGTGRWRDVKLHAFENATHRTYVDLKDKWKTLVHTARISPQQRRGEPVPQELLDRVLSAHAYWFKQQQIKQQGDTCLPF